MRRTREDKISSVKSGTASMFLFVLSVACFVVFLWVLVALVRVILGFGAS